MCTPLLSPIMSKTGRKALGFGALGLASSLVGKKKDDKPPVQEPRSGMF